ncbi:MAG TPA: nucleoside deaminase [Tepidisphaeraceae bacterium]|nr:nucleoside deaminase [Tepidisphaeraceae bacterium]
MRAGNGPAPTGDTPEARLLLRAALDQARHSAAGGGLPIGAVLVRNDQIIGRGCDRSIQSGDPTATAVIDCLRNAGRQLAYGDTVLYTTLLPDHVAAGAVVQLGIGRVVIGEAVHARDGAPPKPPVANLLRAAHVEVLDLHDSACVEMVDTFMREHPERWRSSY